jgi:hypothetical protein
VSRNATIKGRTPAERAWSESTECVAGSAPQHFSVVLHVVVFGIDLAGSSPEVARSNAKVQMLALDHSV